LWAFIVVLSLATALFAPDQTAGLVLLFPVLSLLALVLFFLGFRLRIEVRDGVLTVRLSPLPGVTVQTEDIQSVELVEYSPLRDFGGWGWRFGSKGTLYSVSGNHAVRIEVKSGAPIFIGSGTPAELAAALKASITRQERGES